MILWNITNISNKNGLKLSVRGYMLASTFIQISPNHDKIISGGQDGYLKMWEINGLRF